jgi:hypothetical protein
MSGSDDDGNESPQSKSRRLYQGVFGPFGLPGLPNAPSTVSKSRPTFVAAQLARTQVYKNPSGMELQPCTPPRPPRKRERPLWGQYNFPFESTMKGYSSAVPSPPRSPTAEQWKEVSDQHPFQLAPTSPPFPLIPPIPSLPPATTPQYANMLSPPPCKYQRPPRPFCSNEPLNRPVCKITFPAVDCICIQCAGALAKPLMATCLVCSASIPYSVCAKRTYLSKPQPLMCFECKTAFK